MAYAKKIFNHNFLEYASYVIKDRAIPHINDGLKPVQRRILHSLLEVDDGKFHKVANVVGHCMKYHPHGNASIYSALVVLANKEMFIDKQGNFGNILTGDPASAERYIECRILPLAKQVLSSPEITEYEDSYDGRNKEPITFPAKVPLVIIQGAEGIAVGMATKILPHNFIEVMDAVTKCLRGESFQLFPDFPQKGMVDVSGYEDGLGKVLVRARLDTKDPKKIVIREVPFGTTTEGLINSIENAAKKGKLKIGGIEDYTTEEVEIEIKLPRGVYTQDMVDALYAFTDCEMSISVNLLVIKDNMPCVMTVTEVIQHHAKQLVDVLKQELKLELGKLADRLHARTLERIFIEERIYKKIEEEKTKEGVHNAVIMGFEPFKAEIKREITTEDVERLLKIPIRRISLYDINKARKEIEEITARMKEIRHNLKHITDYAIGFLEDLIQTHGSNFKRATEITSFVQTDVREAANRDKKLYYDAKTGYLGTEVKGGKALFEVSDYDRILVVRKDGDYSVMNVTNKTFVDKDMQYCCLAEKENLENNVYSMLYLDGKTGYPYLKRCKIEKFILDKNYSLIPEGGKLQRFTDRQNVNFEIKYKPKPRAKKDEEIFDVDSYLVKGVKAGGVRLATREWKSGRFISKK